MLTIFDTMLCPVAAQRGVLQKGLPKGHWPTERTVHVYQWPVAQNSLDVKPGIAPHVIGNIGSSV